MIDAVARILRRYGSSIPLNEPPLSGIKDLLPDGNRRAGVCLPSQTMNCRRWNTNTIGT